MNTGSRAGSSSEAAGARNSRAASPVNGVPESSSLRRVPKTRRLLKIFIFVAAIVALNLGGNWILQQLDFQLFPRHDSLMHAAILGIAILYILLMAIPFMPGIELGLALMLLLGHKGALLVYLCTLAALSLSFAVGRLIPTLALIRLLEWLHFGRAGELLRRLEPLDQQQRLDMLYSLAPSRALPLLLRHRYLAVMLLLNLPGNAVIGGGGGIGMAAGISRLFPFPLFVLLIALAVAPVPILFYFEIITPWTR